MMASKKELQEARHQIASGVDEAEMAGSKSAPGDEAHDGDPPERHHHRNRHLHEPNPADEERRYIEATLDAQEEQFRVHVEAKNMMLREEMAARGQAPADYMDRARELRAMRHLAAADPEELDALAGAHDPVRVRDNGRNPHINSFKEGVKDIHMFRNRRARDAGLLVSSGAIEYQKYYEGLSERERVALRKFDAAHSIPGALKMFGKEPNPNHDITIKMHGGERHGAFFLRKERFNMVCEAEEEHRLLNVHETRKVASLGPFKIFN